MTVEQTIEAPVAATQMSPDDALEAGLNRAAEASNNTAKEMTQEGKAPEQQERGTADAQGEPEKAEEQSTSENTNASNVTAEPHKPKSRFQERISDLTNKIKELEVKLAQKGAEQPKEIAKTEETQKAQEPRHYIPPPQKPQYTREQLVQARKKYREAGDIDSVDMIDEELRKVDKYDFEQAAWELKNGRAHEQFQQAQSYYEQEALKKWPELKDAASPITQHFQAVAKIVPELAQRADGRYLMASVASLRIRAAKSDALEQENKKLQEKIAALENKAAPAKQTQATSVGKGAPKTPEQLLDDRFAMAGAA